MFRDLRQALVALRVSLAVSLAMAILLCSCTSSTSITPPQATQLGANQRADLAQKTLDSFASSLVKGNAQGVGAAEETAIAAGHQLGVRDVAFRYLDTVALTTSEAGRYGQSAWAAEISTTYRMPFDPGPTEMTVSMVFSPTPTGVRIMSIGGHNNRSALWLAEPSAIAIGKRVVVIATDRSSVPRFLRFGEAAIQSVNRILPRWTGTLVIEIPSSQDELDNILQTEHDQLADIAAVTTTSDGTQAAASPIHVFANPQVFNSMTDEGAMVVLAHEATHVATRAPLTSMPVWMMEGFADFVALYSSGIGVQTAARQIIARMAKEGIPDHLPTSSDLAPTAGGLGATYEEAWLAWRYIGMRYGAEQAVKFYESVARGMPLDQAFTRVLGTNEARFVRGWQADLRSLVSNR